MNETTSHTGLIEAGANPPAVANPNLSASQMAALARELVTNIRDPILTYTEFGINEAQFKQHVKTNEFFKRVYESSVIEWESVKSVDQRISLKSRAILEDSLPVLGADITDAAHALPARVQAATLIAKLGGIGEDRREIAPGERFTITINLGADTVQTFDKTIGSPNVIDLEAVPVLEKPNDNQSPPPKSNPV
jgi:hypothetical protein